MKPEVTRLCIACGKEPVASERSSCCTNPECRMSAFLHNQRKKGKAERPKIPLCPPRPVRWLDDALDGVENEWRENR